MPVLPRRRQVLIGETEIVGYRISNTAFDFLTTADKIYNELLLASNIDKDDVNKIYATGYGRNSISFADKGISEITAHAKGVHFLYPEVQGIIDVGGQDSKIIVVEDGNVTDFLMNDKCAAGTGKFLEYTAKALEVPINDLGNLALTSRHPAGITSMCTGVRGIGSNFTPGKRNPEGGYCSRSYCKCRPENRCNGKTDGTKGSYSIRRWCGKKCGNEGCP